MYTKLPRLATTPPTPANPCPKPATTKTSNQTDSAEHSSSHLTPDRQLVLGRDHGLFDFAAVRGLSLEFLKNDPWCIWIDVFVFTQSPG